VAGLERVTWHHLRHIHASVLHDIGVPAKIAQKQLGHATVETTLNFYTHAIPDTHRRAIESRSRLFFLLFPNVPKLVMRTKTRKLQSIDLTKLEARVGFEPTNGGFADLSLGPLGYRAGFSSIPNPNSQTAMRPPVNRTSQTRPACILPKS
jgi:Phage integrase family